MELELISFKLCPFVQSTVITLLQHNVDYKITYIDINDPPLWFEELSPTGQVPILKVDNQHVVFESSVINEFINEACECNILPADPLERALQRAWAQFCASILGDMFNLIGAETQSAMEDVEYDIHDKMDKLETMKADSTFFYGDELSLIDSYFAGILMRMTLLKPGCALCDVDRHPRLKEYGEYLLSLQSVKNSVVPEFNDLYIAMVKKRAGYISQKFQ
jgi:glutathione S-transferase